MHDQCPQQDYQQCDLQLQAEKVSLSHLNLYCFSLCGNLKFICYGKAKEEQKGPTKRIGRRPATHVMDYDQTIIPGQVFQSWLQNASDVIGRKRRQLVCTDAEQFLTPYTWYGLQFRCSSQNIV